MIDWFDYMPAMRRRRAVIRIETTDLSELSQITANERVARGGEVNATGQPAAAGRARARREGVDGSQIARDGWSLGL